MKSQHSSPLGRTSSKSKTPKGWPRGILHLHGPAYSKNLNDTALKSLTTPHTDVPLKEQVRRLSGPYHIVKITPISSDSHPAKGQFGLFADQHLPAGSFILPYLGYVHDGSDIDETSDYDLSLDRDLGIGVDASKMGNEARFINDYRGVAAAPNAEFRDIYVDVGNGKAEKRMGIFVLSAGKSGKRAKGIGKGEEILVSYGKGFWTQRQKTQA